MLNQWIYCATVRQYYGVLSWCEFSFSCYIIRTGKNRDLNSKNIVLFSRVIRINRKRKKIYQQIAESFLLSHFHVLFCLMPRLYIQVWQPGTERKASKKVKLLKKYFVVVKLAQYFVCKVDRKPASYCKHKIWVLRFGKLFSQTSGFIPGHQNR